MCTIKFLEIFFRKIWYLLGNNITMLRKANETKRQIIESLNKRLLEKQNYGEGELEGSIESIVKKKHKEMVSEIKKFVDPILGNQMADGKMSEYLDNTVYHHEKGLVKQIMKAIKEDLGTEVKQ